MMNGEEEDKVDDRVICIGTIKSGILPVLYDFGHNIVIVSKSRREEDKKYYQQILVNKKGNLAIFAEMNEKNILQFKRNKIEIYECKNITIDQYNGAINNINLLISIGAVDYDYQNNNCATNVGFVLKGAGYILPDDPRIKFPDFLHDWFADQK